VELELADRDVVHPFSQMYPTVMQLPELMMRSPAVEQICEKAASAIQRLGEFDRVLVMRFAPDWSGHVLAEARKDTVSSFLDLWFPATDIPAQVRKLYETNRVRIIGDSRAQPVAIFPSLNPLSGKPLDLSLSGLRAVSPIHLEYMRNMDVATSMSLSLLGADGRLWGLIVCHHQKARRISLDLRMASEIIARMLSSQIERAEVVEHRAFIEREIVLRSMAKRLLGFIAAETDIVKGFTLYPEELLHFARASGAAIICGGQCHRFRNCPPEEQIWGMIRWLKETGQTEVFTTDRAAEALSSLGDASVTPGGFLSIGISKTEEAWLVWFRSELVQTVKWGGDPRKAEAVPSAGNGSGLLEPRKSFEVWQETIQGRSKPWSDADVDAAVLLRDTTLWYGG
jgi:light-regulated signal transduction histidine kinase (bacteriophytochrome)